MKLIGERVAITEVEEEFTGSIVIPTFHSSVGGDYEIGQVMDIGDKCDFVKPEEFILFQIPQKVRTSTTYKIRNKEIHNDVFSIIHQGDVLAILKNRKITLEGFEIAGNWVLLEMFTDYPSTIAIPNGSVPLEEYRFKVLQMGRGVMSRNPPPSTMDEIIKAKLSFKVGDEVFVERQRCNPIKIDGKEYVFCDKVYIYGVAEYG